MPVRWTCIECNQMKPDDDFTDCGGDDAVCNACYPAWRATGEKAEAQRLADRAESLGCSVAMLKHIELLEYKIVWLEEHVDRLLGI